MVTFLGVARRGNVLDRKKRYHVEPWGRRKNRLPAPALDPRPRGSPCGPISAQNVTTSGHVRASQTFLGVARRGNVFSRGKRYHVGPWGTPRAGVKGVCPESILPPSLSFWRLQKSQNPFERLAPGAKRYHVEPSASPTPKAAWAPTCHFLRLQGSHNPLARMGVARRGNVFSCASSHRMNRSKTLPRRATWPDVVTF